MRESVADQYRKLDHPRENPRFTRLLPSGILEPQWLYLSLKTRSCLNCLIPGIVALPTLWTGGIAK